MSNFLYTEKSSSETPLFKNLRGLRTPFFRIDTFGIRISVFLLEFPGKWALLMKFFCIDPAEDFLPGIL